MKRLLLGMTLLLCSISALSQVPPFVGFTPVPNPPSTQSNSLNAIQKFELEREELEREQRWAARQAAQDAQKKKNDVLQAIGEMKHFIINALGQDIDETLRKQLNEDYKVLGEIATNVRNHGIRNDDVNQLLLVSDDIDNNIVSYLNRVSGYGHAYPTPSFFVDLNGLYMQVETETHIFRLSKIEIADSYTKLYKTIIPKVQHSYVTSSKEQFIEDAATGKKYYILNSSIGFDRSTILNSNKIVEFVETYPALDKTTQSIYVNPGSIYYYCGYYSGKRLIIIRN